MPASSIIGSRYNILGSSGINCPGSDMIAVDG